MITLITMIFSTLGATGMGSLLKVFAGLVDRHGAAAEARQKRELLRDIKHAELDVKWQEVVFGNNESGAFARGTRRIVALIGMFNFAALSILSILYPSVPLTTFKLPQHATHFIDIWGIKMFPMGSDPTVVITTGHLALTSLVMLGAIVGFYFTPAGRK